jgi:hypothetical protein
MIKTVDTQDELFYFNIVSSVVLISRAVLDYYIGRNIYFPIPPP